MTWKNTLYHVLRGQEILTLDEEKEDPIVDGMIYPNDYIMLSAEEKMCKTLLAQYLTCNLTAGKPFLGVFDVPHAVPVQYFATEGRVEDMKDRFIRMSRFTDLNVNNIELIATNFRFNTPEGIKSLKEIVSGTTIKPKLVVIDALYRAIKGSIKDDNVVNEFHHIMGWLINQYDCAVLLVHHFTKPTRDEHGKPFARTAKDVYGSAFLTAGVDHMLWLDKWHSDDDHPKDLVLKCDTQRSGNVPENVRIRLVEPDPLGFQIVSVHEEQKHTVLQLLRENVEGLTRHGLELKSKVARSTLYVVLKELQNEDVVIKEGKKLKVYKLNPFKRE